MHRGLALGVLMTVALAGRLAAQVPAPPPPPPPVPGSATAAPVAAAPAQAPPPATIWNKLGITKDGCAKCWDKCCKSALGQLLSAMVKPLTLMSGGVVEDCCPKTLTQDQLNKLNDPNSNASPAEKAAEAIKADEAGAAARKAAVRYLGTVDCHYFPEAEGGLIAALRQDRNECVRLEAAIALGKGCCCTPKTVKALAIAANGSDEDKNPAETSERVKLAAMTALARCMPHVKERGEPPLPPERPPEAPEPPVVAAGGIRPAVPAPRPRPPLAVEAGRVLAERAGTVPPPRTPPTGQRNLLGLLTRAWSPPPGAEDISIDEAVLTSAPPQQ